MDAPTPRIHFLPCIMLYPCGASFGSDAWLARIEINFASIYLSWHLRIDRCKVKYFCWPLRALKKSHYRSLFEVIMTECWTTIWTKGIWATEVGRFFTAEKNHYYVSKLVLLWSFFLIWDPMGEGGIVPFLQWSTYFICPWFKKLFICKK